MLEVDRFPDRYCALRAEILRLFGRRNPEKTLLTFAKKASPSDRGELLKKYRDSKTDRDRLYWLRGAFYSACHEITPNPMEDAAAWFCYAEEMAILAGDRLSQYPHDAKRRRMLSLQSLIRAIRALRGKQNKKPPESALIGVGFCPARGSRRESRP